MTEILNAKCLIAFGCNLGNCKENIPAAIREIDSIPETRVVKVSSLLETTPVGNVKGQFLNGALLIETSLLPDQLMQHLLRIESDLGRVRSGSRDCDRPIDLDILLFGTQVIESDLLSVPHPRMSFRRFVLEPAVEIAPDTMHPVLKLTLGQLLNRLQTERNVVAVHLKNTELLQNIPDSHEANDDVDWIVPATKSDLLKGLRHRVKTNDGWLVVLSESAEMLRHLLGAIKLLVVVEDPGDPSDETSTKSMRAKLPSDLHSLSESLQEWRGPCWVLPSSTTEELKSSILTAIESMKPIKGD